MLHIQKKHSRLIRHLGLITIAVFGIISTLGSGGGGGDGGGPQPVVYNGNTNPASITLANAPTLVSLVLEGGSNSSNIPAPVPVAASISSSEVQSGGVAVVPDHLLALLHYSLDDIIGNTVTGYNIPLSLELDEKFDCESGYYTLEGILDDATLTGTLSYNYVNCLTEGFIFNGSGTFRIDSFLIPFDATISMTLMSITSAEFNGGISGSMRLESTILGNSVTDTITMDYVAEDYDTGKTYKFENLVMTMIVDDITSPNSTGSLKFTGTPAPASEPARVYDPVYGYVTVDTPTPLSYSDITLIYPDDGGVMTFTGDNSSIQLTVMSGRHVRLDLDIDGIAGYEVVRYLLWEELAIDAGTDLTDTDSDGMHDSWENMFSPPLDPDVSDPGGNPDGDGLTNLEEYQQGYDPTDPNSP